MRAGDWIIVSGQLGLHDGVLVPGGVAAQTAQAVVNLKERLAEMGADITDVAKTSCFLTDMDTFATFNDAYVTSFTVTTRSHAAPSAWPLCPPTVRSRSRRGPSSRWPPGSKVDLVAGAIILVVALLLFPIVVGLSTALLAGVIGEVLSRDEHEKRNEGSELVDLNVSHACAAVQAVRCCV